MFMVRKHQVKTVCPSKRTKAKAGRSLRKLKPFAKLENADEMEGNMIHMFEAYEKLGLEAKYHDTGELKKLPMWDG